MRIAVFTEGYDPFINGVVTSVKTLQRTLRECGHEVAVFGPEYPGHEDKSGDVARLPSVRWSRMLYPSLSPLAWTRDVLAGRNFDVVHSHHPFTMSRLAVRLARQHRLPLVYSFHTMLTEYAHYVPLLRNAAERCLARTFLGHCAEADYVTAPTAVAREFLLEQGVKARVAVVPTAVPPLQPTPGSRERVRRELGVGRDTPLLLYAARLSKEKQLDFLVRAVARLEPSHQFRLCLAGGRPVQRELRRLAARLGITESVTFCGWIPHEQMPDYYAAADVFVFPSTSDTLGVALVEAMGVGLPCVAVDRYGPGEVVMDGESGLLVPFDEAAFATAVGRLLRDQALRHRIAEAARRRARDFAPEPVTDRLCAVYREAALSHRFASAGAIGTAPRRSRGWWKCASWS